MFVQRKGTTVARFPNVQHDGTWIRAVSRLGLAFLNEAGAFPTPPRLSRSPFPAQQRDRPDHVLLGALPRP